MATVQKYCTSTTFQVLTTTYNITILNFLLCFILLYLEYLDFLGCFLLILKYFQRLIPLAVLSLLIMDISHRNFCCMSNIEQFFFGNTSWFDSYNRRVLVESSHNPFLESQYITHSSIYWRTFICSWYTWNTTSLFQYILEFHQIFVMCEQRNQYLELIFICFIVSIG